MSATDVSANAVLRLRMLCFRWDSSDHTRVVPLITNGADSVEIVSGSVVIAPTRTLRQLSFNVLLQISRDRTASAHNVTGNILGKWTASDIVITTRKNLRFRLVEDDEELFPGEKHVCSVIVEQIQWTDVLLSSTTSGVAHLVCKVEEP